MSKRKPCSSLPQSVDGNEEADGVANKMRGRYASKAAPVTHDVRIRRRMKNAFPYVVVVCICLSQPAVAQRDGDDRALSIGLSRSEEFNALHGEIMAEHWANTWLSGSYGASFFLSSDTGIHGGLEARVRAGLPKHISPFAGAGLMLGRWTYHVDANDDGNDNDGDHWVDEHDEEQEEHDYLAAIYPEAGLRLWLGDSFSLTGCVRYYVTTAGRDSDCLLYGASLGMTF